MLHDLPASHPRIAIVGAGMAGVSCAQTLRERGMRAMLFEKSRGAGGRMATRRHDDGVAFDHGAQYVTAHTPAFAARLDAWQRAGAAAIWQPREPAAIAAHRQPWVVGMPGMNGLLRPLGEALNLRTGVAVKALRRMDQRWQLVGDAGELDEPFDIVVSTAPAPQTRALLDGEPALQHAIDGVAMAPCWALMLCLRQPLPVAFDARRTDAGPIAWMARQASRPARAAGAHAWVLHASPQWSQQHLEHSAEAVTTLLLDALAASIGEPLPEIDIVQAHRWRHALTTRPLGQPFLARADHSLFAGGDWCLGARVECAYQSGVAIAEAIAARWG